MILLAAVAPAAIMCGMAGAFRDLAIGAAAGYAAGRAMDLATGLFHARQSHASRRREDELLPGGAPAAAGRRVGDLLGTEPTEEQAQKLGHLLHRAAAVQYGMVVAAVARRGVAPMVAGLGVAAAAFVLVDEGLNAATLSPPPTAYPLASHLRGAAGHLTLGLTAGAALAVARRLGAIRH